jgi:hypothetical protein
MRREDRRTTRKRVHMSVLTDLRFAVRSLARVKGLAVTVILTLALGIGANAAIFSVVGVCFSGHSSTAARTG